MAEIYFYDEYDLQRKIKGILNKKGFSFEIVSRGFDLIDLVNKIYVEVKRDNFNPAQILYSIAKNEIKDIKFIGLACAFEIRFYKVPSLTSIYEFAKEIDKTLTLSPSSITKQEHIQKAYELLGNHYALYTYKGDLDLKNPNTLIFVDAENLVYFRLLFEKYKIDPSKFLPYISSVYAKNHEIIVNNRGWILNINTGEFFRNTDEQQQTIDEHIDIKKFNYKPILDHRDKTLFTSIRIKGNNIKDLLHQMDKIEPIDRRRKKGRFFTKDNINKEIYDICEQIAPDFIIEPYCGSGSLIDGIIKEYSGHANDINKGFIDTLKATYEGLNWTFSAIDTIQTPTEELIQRWHIPIGKNILILTNPPFGAVSTNILASKKGEIEKETPGKLKLIMVD